MLLSFGSHPAEDDKAMVNADKSEVLDEPASKSWCVTHLSWMSDLRLTGTQQSGTEIVIVVVVAYVR